MRTDIRPGPRLVVIAAGLLGLVVASLGGLLGWRLLHSGAAASAPPVPLDAALDPPAPPEVLVYVSGAVNQPGLYRLSSAARVSDAVAAAGGFTADADPGRLPDLASLVHDGRQVNIPFRKGTAGTTGSSTSIRIPFAQRLDVNTASVEELRSIPTMPIGLPEAIVDARATFGPFISLAQLKAVLGLDGTTFSAVRAYLRAGNSTR